MELVALIKKAHSQILQSLEQEVVSAADTGSAGWQFLAGLVQEQLAVERDYIFSEVQDRSRSVKITLAKLEATQAQILGMITLEHSRGASEIRALHALLASYFGIVQERLLVIVRQQLSTQEREELAEVVEDALSDRVFASGMVAAG